MLLLCILCKLTLRIFNRETFNFPSNISEISYSSKIQLEDFVYSVVVSRTNIADVFIVTDYGEKFSSISQPCCHDYVIVHNFFHFMCNPLEALLELSKQSHPCQLFSYGTWMEHSLLQLNSIVPGVFMNGKLLCKLKSGP